MKNMEFAKENLSQNSLYKRILSSLIMIAIASFAIYSKGIIYTSFIVLIGIISITECLVIIFRSRFSILKQILWAFFVIIYISMPCMLMSGVMFWMINDEIGLTSDFIFTSVFMVLLICGSDIGAYFAGNMIGGKKLCSWSPSKTWSGLLGGMLCAQLFGYIFIALYALYTKKCNVEYFCYDSASCTLPQSSINRALFALGPKIITGPILFLLSIITSLLSQIGDLLQSKFKRHFNVKDSGFIIPGHGGVTDRIDGILFVLWVYALFFASLITLLILL